MQVTNPGRKLWDAIFRDKADKIYAELPANSLLKPSSSTRTPRRPRRLLLRPPPRQRPREPAHLHTPDLSDRCCQAHDAFRVSLSIGNIDGGRSLIVRVLSKRSAKRAVLVSASTHRNLERRASRLYVAFRMRREVEIVNKLGLHARPAAEFVRCVIRFKSTITKTKGMGLPGGRGPPHRLDPLAALLPI